MRSRPATVIAWSLCALTLGAAAIAGAISVSDTGTDWARILPAKALPSGPSVDAGEYEGLRDRHDQLKQTVASSLRKLDEILTGMPQ